MSSDIQPINNQYPWNQLDGDLQAWMAAEAQKAQMQEMLKQMLAMIAAMKDPQMAFMMCMNQLMPQMLAVQDSGAGLLGAANNCDTDIQKFLTQIQNFFNEGGNISSADAGSMCQYVDQLEAQLKTELAGAQLNPKLSPYDVQDLQTMIKAIDDFKGMFGDHWDNGAEVASDMVDIFSSDPDPIWAGALKQLTNDLQMVNQASGAMSTQTGTLISYATENYKQFMGIVQDCFQEWGQFVAAEVKNQISH